MRIFRKITMALSALALCAACTSEDDVFQPEGNLENGLTATIPAYQFDDGTRVNISDDLQTFTWSDNDELGIYYTDNTAHAQAGFTIRQGGSSTGVFSNDIFYLNPEKTYYAFYPYNSSFTTTTAEVDFTGQTQTANASAAHLGAYNYMYGSVDISSNGGASVAFKNLGAVMAAKLTVPTAAVYKSLTITSDNVEFTTKGTASMVNGAVTSSETSPSVTLSFGDSGISLEANAVLTAYLLTTPVDMSGSTLTFTLTDESGNSSELALEGKNMLAGKAYLYEGTYVVEDDTPYVTFTAEAEQTLQMSSSVSTLEYSVNGSSWAELGTTQVIFGGTNGELRLRGKSPTGTGGSIISFGNDTKVACSGDIRTLVNYENYSTAPTSSAQFQSLFYNCTQLTSAPELPAMSLATKCYDSMFRGCISLKVPPALPATTLASYCYHYMFANCSSLSIAPVLPATTLASYCYNYMFYYCTSLLSAPALPATALADHCYSQMFEQCHALIHAPELPATNLVNNCYESMFYGCTSLVTPPALPAEELAYYCYGCMFYLCTSLASAPELPATTLVNSCYKYMFANCTSLLETPDLPATKLVSECYYAMFGDCKALVTVKNLPATTLAPYCYYRMFTGCKSLTSVPMLPAKTLESSCYNLMFYNCSSLDYIKMMATDISASSCLSNWVSGVASSGTFVKDPSMTSLTTGTSGIPEGWTVIDYTDSTGPDMSGSDMGGDW